MSLATSTQKSHPNMQAVVSLGSSRSWKKSIGWIESMVADLQQMTAPVWPLADYVAVHPYLGWLDHKFDNAHAVLRAVSDCELLPKLEDFSSQFQAGKFTTQHIQVAVEELLAPAVDATQFVRELALKLTAVHKQPGSDVEDSDNDLDVRSHICPASTLVDELLGTEWTETIHHEVGRFCTSYYDEGQATCVNPFQSLPLFAAWKAMASIDRNLDILGLNEFCKFVSSLPTEPHAAISYCLKELAVPQRLWKEFLLSQILALPGWFAWTRYKTEANMRQDNPQDDFAELLAVRMAFDLGLCRALKIPIVWDAFEARLSELNDQEYIPVQDPKVVERHILLRASEVAFCNEVLSELGKPIGAVGSQYLNERKLAQLIFCIDVRSERIRRHFESVSGAVETFGFAGFFGVPMAYRRLGAKTCSNQLPVLLTPKFKVQEGLPGEKSAAIESEVGALKQATRLSRKLWKQFQSTAFSCFAFVESMGWLYGWKLARQSLGFHAGCQPHLDGATDSQYAQLGPTLAGLEEQGFGLSEQTKMAESILKNLGLTGSFARLVVFCGHASKTSNNPLAASLDCGACGGHSGEANARFAAMLLNQPAVRMELQQRGIEIPEDTHFLAAVHNTTTDAVEFFDVAAVPEGHQQDLVNLRDIAGEASYRNRCERALTFADATPHGLSSRSVDWSEVRPEWGLAGNAAFIVAPRQVTQAANLAGRAFLHSYDCQQDPDGSVLELIMTAPMVVAHWINMQYFASSVDPQHFSSGSKTIHNVAGQFGIVAGNGGDLCIGLPLESLHNGVSRTHQPLRLLAIIAAPRTRIEQAIEKHHLLQHIFKNQWMHLVAIDDGRQYRLQTDLTWTAYR
ncbi:MAG: DUF2309 domain-containing protein [Planctomycetales bacterium]|nr:DUF2309 domain-containing protein [Planctomycetales bacterium]